jgi:hypothetical protein
MAAARMMTAKLLPPLVARGSGMRTTTLATATADVAYQWIENFQVVLYPLLAPSMSNFASSRWQMKLREAASRFGWCTPHNINRFEAFLYSDQQRG